MPWGDDKIQFVICLHSNYKMSAHKCKYGILSFYSSPSPPPSLSLSLMGVVFYEICKFSSLHFPNQITQYTYTLAPAICLHLWCIYIYGINSIELQLQNCILSQFLLMCV